MIYDSDGSEIQIYWEIQRTDGKFLCTRLIKMKLLTNEIYPRCENIFPLKKSNLDILLKR